MTPGRVPELEIEMSVRTVEALLRESEWPGIELHRRCIEAENLTRRQHQSDLMDRIDDLLAALS